MSVTSARTLQIRRSMGTGEFKAGLCSDFWEGAGDPSRTVTASTGRLSSVGTISLISEKSPVWLRESGPGEGEDGLLAKRSFPRRARRLARVGGLSSLS